MLLGEWALPERYEASRLLRHVGAFLEAGSEGFSLAYQVVERAEQALREGREPRGEGGQRLLYAADRVEFLPPVPRPGKIVATGSNFAAHAAEMGIAVPSDGPSGFLKAPSTLVGHNGAIVYPEFSGGLDYELELGIVIGRRTKRVGRDAALQHVAGYTVFNDLSARDLTRRGNLMLGKNFDTAGAMGPYLVTADEIREPQGLTLELRVNGELRQQGNTAQMQYDVAALIAHWSQMTLLPGDVLTSGTPAGVAAGRPDDEWYLRPGDVIEASIARVGTLRNTVRPA
jgi:2-keto-4-pentenoate hydratase/2-oxohepta-3-ene-1,7-dioic acid hydratase in catechol pathway